MNKVVPTDSLLEEAIKQAEKNRPDLVLMDIMLDGEMDGIEAAAIIKKDLDKLVVDSYLEVASENLGYKNVDELKKNLNTNP